MVRRRCLPRPPVFDVVVWLLLLPVGLLEVSHPGPDRVLPHPGWSGLVWVASIVPFPWRRRIPWWFFAWQVVASIPDFFPDPNSGTLAGYAVLCIALYTLAREDGRVELLVGAAAIGMAVLVVHYSLDPKASNQNQGIQASYLILLASPVLGRLVRDRAERTSGLESELVRQREQQEANERAAAVAERARIARELHDIVAHSLSVVIVQSGAALGDFEDGDPLGAKHRVEAMERVARHALADMRRLVAADDGPETDDSGPQPGVRDLPVLLDEVRAAGLVVELTIEGNVEALPAGVDLTVFRIVQESLTNALNHAPGATAWITLTFAPTRVELSVANNSAVGPDRGPGGGRGLVGMRERARLYDGTLVAQARDDGGYEVRLTLPLEAAPT
ncbi:MAG: histidine kinase [Ilumatobacteraceae bacterium]